MDGSSVPSGPEPIADASSLSIAGYGEVRFLARGGSSMVYRALRESDGREVAIKVVDGHGGRHHRELEAFRRLAGTPHVLAMLDHGTLDDGRTWIATEYADLGSADGLIRAGPLPAETVARFGAQVASALAAAHDAGITHADVKPSNLLITAEGGVLLADFGIAQTDPTATGPATMSMTLLYSAPEVLLGEAPSASSDIYSLGLTLYALVTGKNPFDSTSSGGVARLVDLITTGPPPAPPETTPPWLSAVIDNCTAKDPADRYRSAAHLAEDLANRQATPPTGPRPRRKPAAGTRRRWSKVGMGIGIVVLLVGAAAGAWLRFAGSGTNPCIPAVSTLRVGERPYGVIFDETHIWVANRTSNTVSRIDPGSGTVIATLDVSEGPRGLAFDGTDIWVSNLESNTVARVDRGSNWVTETISVGENPAELAHDGTAVWVANQMSDSISRIDPVTNSVTHTLPVGSMPYGLTFADDAIWVANSGSTFVSRVDPVTATVSTEIDVGGKPFGVAFDGELVWVSVTESNRVLTIDPETDEIVDDIEVESGPFGMAFVGATAWVANDSAATVTAIDRETMSVTDRVSVGPNPWAIAADDSDVWVPSGGANEVSRIEPCGG